MLKLNLENKAGSAAEDRLRGLREELSACAALEEQLSEQLATAYASGTDQQVERLRLERDQLVNRRAALERDRGALERAVREGKGAALRALMQQETPRHRAKAEKLGRELEAAGREVARIFEEYEAAFHEAEAFRRHVWGLAGANSDDGLDLPSPAGDTGLFPVFLSRCLEMRNTVRDGWVRVSDRPADPALPASPPSLDELRRRGQPIAQTSVPHIINGVPVSGPELPRRVGSRRG